MRKKKKKPKQKPSNPDRADLVAIMNDLALHSTPGIRQRMFVGAIMGALCSLFPQVFGPGVLLASAAKLVEKSLIGKSAGRGQSKAKTAQPDRKDRKAKRPAGARRRK
jgi:hypothetical protein